MELIWAWQVMNADYYTISGQIKSFGVHFLLPSNTLLIDVHALCLLIHRTRGWENTCCWLGIHNEAGHQVKSQLRFISLCKLNVQLLLCCAGGKGHPWKVIFALKTLSSRRHEATSVQERDCLRREDKVGEWNHWDDVRCRWHKGRLMGQGAKTCLFV